MPPSPISNAYYAEGDVLVTLTGRSTSPFPRIDTANDQRTRNTLKRQWTWLCTNALAEAEARNDDFNRRMFAQESQLAKTPAAQAGMLLYLFGDC